MKKYINIMSIVFIFIVLIGTASFAFFNYTKTGNNTRLIAGSLYLTMNEGVDSINISNVFPETKEEARSRNDNVLTFTLKGKNTSDNKAIYYEILLNNGEDNNQKQRYNTKDLVFDLVEVGTNNEETYVLDAVSFETLQNQKIWVDKVDENTDSEITRTYKLRMWISSDVVISETDPNKDYTPTSFKNGYANVKISVEGDLQEKELPLFVRTENTINANNETKIDNVISNIDSENNEDTYTLIITSSNDDVEFVYRNDAVLANINSVNNNEKLSQLINDNIQGKIKKIDNNEIISNSFEMDYVLANNKKVTISVYLRSKSGNNILTDLAYTLKKNNTVIQKSVKHINVYGNKPVPQIEFVNKTTTYSGSSVTLDNVTIKNSDNTNYTGTVNYTYYKGGNCTGQEIGNAPINAGLYSVKIYVQGSGNDGSSSSCGTITINQKNLTANINNCLTRAYDGTNNANCTFTLSGVIENDKVNAAGTCTTDSEIVANDKDVTCSNLELHGENKDNYSISSSSIIKQNALNIEKAILKIKADNKQIEYHSQDPEYSYTAVGLVNNETVSVLTGSITYTIKSGNTVINDVSTASLGTYTIVPSGLSSNNYDIVYESGSLKISSILVASINTCTDKNYDGNQNVNCTISLAGVASGDNVIGHGDCRASSSDAGTNKTVTCSNVELTGSSSYKYGLSSTSCEKENAVNINKTNLTLTAANKSMNYGLSAPTYSYTITGFVNNETNSVLSGEVVYTIKNGDITVNDVSVANAGIYDIVPSGLSSNNYNISFVNGSLTINLTTPTLSLQEKNEIYTGAPIIANAVTVNPDVGAEVTYTYYATTNCSGDALLEAPTNVGNYSVKATVAAVANKTNTNSICKTHTITKATATNSVEISGTTTWGSTLTTTITTNSDGIKGYQWYYNDNDSTSGGTAIVGATNSTYVVASDYIGKYIYVVASVGASNNYTTPSDATAITETTISKQTSCAAPTNISITPAGIVTWTASASAIGYQISIDDLSYSDAVSGIDYKNTIINTAGNRTIYIKSKCDTDYYVNSMSNSATGTTTVYSVTLTKGTGILSVTGAGNYISGSTVTLSATTNDADIWDEVSNNARIWDKWTDTSTSTTISTINQYSAIITSDWAYTANGRLITASEIRYDNDSITSCRIADNRNNVQCALDAIASLLGYGT